MFNLESVGDVTFSPKTTPRPGPALSVIHVENDLMTQDMA
jgi:hypothetical protein